MRSRQTVTEAERDLNQRAVEISGEFEAFVDLVQKHSPNQLASLSGKFVTPSQPSDRVYVVVPFKDPLQLVRFYCRLTRASIAKPELAAVSERVGRPRAFPFQGLVFLYWPNLYGAAPTIH